jgi:integrase
VSTGRGRRPTGWPQVRRGSTPAWSSPQRTARRSSRASLNRHWYGVRDRAGLAGVRLRDLRHTCVTLLLDAGVPPHVVRAIAGHSGIEVTMTIYAHAAREEQRQALRGLAQRLG